MQEIRVLPYKNTSQSAAALSKGLHSRRINVSSQTYKPSKKDILLNWGNTSEYAYFLQPRVGKIFNPPDCVDKAVNKIRFLEICTQNDIPCPRWTTNRADATVLARTNDIVARTLITAHGGRGIALIKRGTEELPEAKLYTVYVPKKTEYRVHVCGDNVFDVQQKKLKRGTQNPNFQIRSWDNGWIFARQGVKFPDEVAETAVKAVKALGLDFGAVDVGWNELKKQPIVYEVNTAPGIEGETLDTYIKTIKGMVESYVRTKNRKERARTTERKRPVCQVSGQVQDRV